MPVGVTVAALINTPPDRTTAAAVEFIVIVPFTLAVPYTSRSGVVVPTCEMDKVTLLPMLIWPPD